MNRRNFFARSAGMAVTMAEGTAKGAAAGALLATANIVNQERGRRKNPAAPRARGGSKFLQSIFGWSVIGGGAAALDRALSSPEQQTEETAKASGPESALSP